MARRAKNNERFIVTGPGFVEGDEPSYSDPGPAMSRALTAALKASPDVTEGSWYWRDVVGDKILGHCDVLADHTVRVVRN